MAASGDETSTVPPREAVHAHHLARALMFSWVANFVAFLLVGSVLAHRAPVPTDPVATYEVIEHGDAWRMSGAVFAWHAAHGAFVWAHVVTALIVALVAGWPGRRPCGHDDGAPIPEPWRTRSIRAATILGCLILAPLLVLVLGARPPYGLPERAPWPAAVMLALGLLAWAAVRIDASLGRWAPALFLVPWGVSTALGGIALLELPAPDEPSGAWQGTTVVAAGLAMATLAVIDGWLRRARLDRGAS